MDEEFREDDVLDIIATALEVESEEHEVPQTYLPLAFNEGRLLEVLSETLPRYMQRADMQVVLDELRGHLYSGISETGLRTLHSMTKNCHRCPALADVSADIPSWNLVDPDMVLVLEGSAIPQESLNLLISTLSKVGFSSRNLTLTFINRCKAQGRKHSADEVQNCLSYIHTELQLLKPKLIVTLGATASAAIFSTPISLGDDRGNIMWMGPWAIMPTWAPGYALNGKGRITEQFEQDLQTAFRFVYGRSE